MCQEKLTKKSSEIKINDNCVINNDYNKLYSVVNISSTKTFTHSNFGNKNSFLLHCIKDNSSIYVVYPKKYTFLVDENNVIMMPY